MERLLAESDEREIERIFVGLKHEKSDTPAKPPPVAKVLFVSAVVAAAVWVCGIYVYGLGIQFGFLR